MKRWGAVILVAIGTMIGVASKKQVLAEAKEVGRPRTLHFPADRSVGQLYVSTIEEEAALVWIEWGSPWERQFLAEAKGAVVIPQGMFSTLFVSSEGWQDLSPLSALEPDALDGIVINPSTLSNAGDISSGGIPKATPACLEPVCHLTGLQLLVWSETPISNEKLRSLTKLRSLERLHLAADYGDEDALHLNDESLAIIGQLKSLKGLRIYTKVPISEKGLAHLSQLTHLRTIRIGAPKFQSKELSCLSSLTALEEVSLMLGVLSTPETLMPLVSLPYLKDLDLHWGRESLEREALEPLAQLSSVETLRLVCVEEEETLEIVSRMKSLKKLIMDLCADVPLSPLARLPDLQVLKIESRCTDQMLEGIEECPALKLFNAHSAGIGYTLRGLTDVGVSRIAGIQTLEEIELWSGNFTNAALQSLSQCQRLRRLLIPNNYGFTDEGMVYAAKLADLEELHLRGELLTLIGFERIATLKNLKALSLLTAWKLDDTGLEKLTLLTDLEKLKFLSRAATLAGVSRLNVLKNLVELRATGVQGADTVLQIPDLSRLERLHISSVSDGDLACLKGLKELKSLEIDGPGLTDRGLDPLKSIPSLHKLRVGPRTQVTDEGLRALQKDMPALQWCKTRPSRG